MFVDSLTVNKLLLVKTGTEEPVNYIHPGRPW